MRPCASFLAAILLATAAPSQTGYAVGQRDLGWLNTSGQGTPWLYTRVLYPSPTGGVHAPLEPNPSGWPVIVFLHGFGHLGREYVELSQAWVSQGFAVVLVDSAQFSFFDEAFDGRAQYAAIVDANRDSSSFFAGAFDTQRIAIAGHSMGGGAMALILANNPGYRCGFAIAPVWPGTTYVSQVTVPMALATGAGDVVTPWYLHAHPYYHELAPQTGLKLWYQMDASCDHMNIVGLKHAEAPVFARTVSLGLGFFRHFLDIDAGGLDQCLGPGPLSDPHLLSLTSEIVQPRIWAAGQLAPGRIVRISLAAANGLGGMLAAPSTGWSTPTSLGTLLLDPQGTFAWATGISEREQRIDAMLTVPNNANLVGVTIAMQGIGATSNSPLLLGSATEFVVH